MDEIKDLAIMIVTPVSPIIAALATIIIIPNALIATAIGLASFFGMMYMGRNIDMDL